MKVLAWRAAAARKLEAAASPDPAADARLLCWGDSQHELSDAETARLDALLARRLAGEPVQYVLRSAWLMGLEFYVDERVLIPRQDTETLCEAALKILRAQSAPQALDLCAGSGAIGLSLAALAPGARVTLSDVSEGACAVARINRDRLGVQAEILQGDLFAPVRGRRFDVIVCNPPYIPTDELGLLQPEVRREPSLALDGGADGLAFYRRIAQAYRAHLRPGGALLVEIGWNQAKQVRALFGGGETLKDLGGRDRVVVIRE